MTTAKYRRLCQNESDTISRLRKLGKSQVEIAEAIGFSPSCVSREIARNTG
jgi:IS30 family transposase